jgi:glycolate oxidase iron-sulfur subunit
MADLDYSVVQQCMHCGMCLPSCPTYLETRQERNSPRGRIALMRAIADGNLEVTKEFGEEMYYCLGCLACTTACPAGGRRYTWVPPARASIHPRLALSSGSSARAGKAAIFMRKPPKLADCAVA